MPGALDLAQERTRDEEARGQVRPQRLLPALERKLPDRDVLARPHAGDGGAHVDATERSPSLVEQALDVLLGGEVGLGERSSSELFRYRAGALFASVVVDEHVRALGGERTSTRRADAARGTGDEHALALKARVDAA